MKERVYQVAHETQLGTMGLFLTAFAWKHDLQGMSFNQFYQVMEEWQLFRHMDFVPPYVQEYIDEKHS